MVEISSNQTIAQIYEYYAASAGDWRRPHLGASQIGTPCIRKLWYQFRWSAPPSFDGRIYRLFNTGHREEDRILSDLRNIGIKVYDHDEKTGRQFSFSDPAGHYSGSVDAIAMGFPEAPDIPHVVEIKTSNKRGFEALKKKGVESVKPIHYAQMQQYMEWARCTRAYYLVVCKDNDEIYGERVKWSKPFSDALTDKAREVIYGDLSPYGTNDCQWCDYKSICEGKALPTVSCRTCEHARAVEGNIWRCEKKNIPIHHRQAVLGCKDYTLHHCYAVE